MRSYLQIAILILIIQKKLTTFTSSSSLELRFYFTNVEFCLITSSCKLLTFLFLGGVTDHQDSFVLTSAPLERITEEQTTVHCWKTMYNLLELYSTMPTTKTVQRHSLTPLTSNSMLDAGILLRAGNNVNKHVFHNFII